MKIKLFLMASLLFSATFYAQNAVLITGKVLAKAENLPVTIANVSVVGATNTVLVDDNGAFVLEFKKALPAKIEIKAIGFKTYIHVANTSKETITVYLEEDVTSLDEIVLSASRTPERVFESPVSVERIGIKAIETTTSPSFYDGLENLKGVDVNTSSLTFKSVNTRGFASIGNSRFVQLVDGMDNSSPGLSFALGNLIGLNELDVQSVELLPGASSALYGANAFNGIMFMRSKSPFTHQGVSVYGKSGFTNSENAGVNGFVDVGARVAGKISDNVALKFTTSFLQGTDWFASDTRNINSDGEVINGNRNDPNYNGINIYGDEISANIRDVGRSLEALDPSRFAGISQILPDESVSRTGYSEQDLIDPKTNSFRAAFSAHVKPVNMEDTELVFNSKFGTGNTIYQAASRYALRNFIMHQHKIELRAKNFFVRAYATLEDAGDSYDIRFAGINSLRPSNQQWYGTYAGAYAQALEATSSTQASHQAARQAADAALRPLTGTQEFTNVFNRVINDSDVSTGAKFVDSSRMLHSDINYNFKDLIKFAEVQLGGSARRFILNSEGTLFTDTKDSNISYDEFGIYTQVQKKLANDRLKLTGSLRYDKAQNFDGNFSPRASVSFSIDEEKRHNIRASFQTGFRNPTTQDQYIGLDIGRTILIGSAPGNPEKYNKTFGVSSDAGKALVGGTSVGFNGLQGYNNAFTQSSVEALSEEKIAEKAGAIVSDPNNGITDVEIAVSMATGEALAGLKQADIDFVKPEQVRSFEIGYRGKLSSKTVLDFSAYYNEYTDFIAIVTTVAPLYGDVSKFDLAELQAPELINNSKALINAIQEGEFTPTSLYTNTGADVASYGLNIGVETKMFGNYDFGVNYTFAKQDFDQSQDPDFETGFNTPEHKVKVSFGNTDVYKGIGFGVNARWQDAFFWQSTFVDAKINARTVVDVQAMYTINKWNSKVKVGAANLLGNNYQSAPAAGTVGSQIYGAWTYNF